MKRRYNKISFILVACLFPVLVWAQQGGVASPFLMGSGARQLGAGGAASACPQDPTAIFWNPASLEALPMQTFTAFYASLPYGTSYNFIGYVYPTLNLGTFGIGIHRIATGGIPERDEGDLPGGEFSYNQDEIYFSYAKNVWNQLSIGLNLKRHHQVIGQFSDTGFGADLGVFYQSDMQNMFLQNLKIGLSVYNAYSPRLKPGVSTDHIPHNIRFGLAREFNFGDERSPFVLMLDLNKAEHQSFRVNVGTEYSYQQHAMLRLGYNDSNGLTFGVGAAYQKFQLDYAYARIAEGVFPESHRISFTVGFGRSRQELFELAEEKRRQEIGRKLAEEREQARQETVERLMGEGKQYYTNGDYLNALIRFTQVLELDEGNPEAEEMVSEANIRISELREREAEESAAKIQEERERRQLMDFINTHVSKGVEYLEAGDYNAAIAEWELALERQPDSKLIKDYIEKAKAELVKQIDVLIQEADKFAKRGEYNEAIQVLSEAQILSQNDLARQEQITRRIDMLERRLNVYDFYQQGLIAYRAENWREAMKDFEKALKLDPKNREIKKFYQEAKRRALAREQQMTPAMQKRFYRAVNIYLEDHIEEAIGIWEELLQEQPYNKRIIDSIDKARKQLARQRKSTK